MTSRPQYHEDSSEDEGANKNDIDPSTFSRSRINNAAMPGGSMIGGLLAQYGHSEPARPRPDAMSSGYTNSRPIRQERPQLPPQKRQMMKPKEVRLEDIDFNARTGVSQLMQFFPGLSVRTCFDAYLKSRGDVGAASSDLMDQRDREAKAKAQRGVDIDLTDMFDTDEDLDELNQPTPNKQSSFKRPGEKATTKVQAVNKASIKDKYASKPAAHAISPARPSIPVDSSPMIREATPPQPVRKRLMQGRRPRSPTPPTVSSPVIKVATPPPPRAAARKARGRLAESDDEEEAELEAVETEDEEDEAIDLTDDRPDLEARLIATLNKCSVEELVDLSRQPLETAKNVLEHRPFTTLDDVRKIVIETTTIGKTGKPRVTKKKIGDKFADVCMEMYQGYEAVDQLVLECAEISKPITAEMRAMGMDLAALQATGELTFTELDNDSGIGTPCSNIGDDDANVRTKKPLSQPSTMSKEFVLKDYQIAGLNWMAMMWRQKLSGILADDMGLGKTCQVISFITHLVETGQKGPHLIVVPGSTLENWLREFERFSDTLVVLPYYGSLKEREEFREDLAARREAGELNVVVTTYETAKNRAEDNAFLRKGLRPVVCVFDEGHFLKNSTTKMYKELMRIPAKMRLLLTGTPLQNNLQELVSLLAFIMPSMFEQHAEELEYIFKHKAGVKDASSQEGLLSRERIVRARSMMAPFILRRKKDQVLKHMVAKECRVEYCDMTTEQATIYKGEITKVHNVLKARIAAKERGEKSWTVQGTANNLMRLRLASIHPLLMRHHFTDAILNKMVVASRDEEDFRQLTKDKDKRILEDFMKNSDFQLHQFCQYHSSVTRLDPLRKTEDEAILNSGKVTKLIDLLLKFKANGDRTLVFSKFTMTLDILELVLNHYSLRFCRLDGSTQMAQRQELIDQFYKDEDISVFMLSTGAGGAGINLAAANKVVIFDMSFNPQDDIQAENRAHRVGQTRDVEVVRLVTRGTIEEQIYRLGETKMALDERVTGGAVPSAAVDVAVDGEKAEEAGAGKVMEMMLEDLEKRPGGEKGEGDGKKVKEEDVDMKEAFADGLKKVGLDVKIEV